MPDGAEVGWPKAKAVVGANVVIWNDGAIEGAGVTDSEYLE